ncbi:MAG: DUF2624 family protein, partial [Bacilli bacterium]|nr:DUF2624 family protein [Bacilli bacterium]
EMNSISTKELLREICKYARENGVKLNQTQAKIVLKALKDISVDTCKRGERLIIRDFLIIEGVMTSIKRLPDGKCNTPRLKIKVEVSEALKERFRIEQKELEKLKKPKEDNFD